MTNKTMACPDCQANMQYRLGEFECDECGRKLPAAEADQEERLAPRRVASPTFTPGRSRQEFDVERGHR